MFFILWCCILPTKATWCWYPPITLHGVILQTIILITLQFSKVPNRHKFCSMPPIIYALHATNILWQTDGTSITRQRLGKRLLTRLCNSWWINPLLRNTSTTTDAVGAWNRHREKPHQGQDWARNPKITGAQEETMDTPGRQNWARGLKRRILRRITEYQELDIVEGSTPSEAKKETVLEWEEPDMGEHRPLKEFSSPLVRVRKRICGGMWEKKLSRMLRIWTDGTLSGSHSGRTGFKDGADVAVLRRLPWRKEEWKWQEGKTQATGRKLRPITDVGSQALGRKWWYTIRLFATNSLKKGAVWQIDGASIPRQRLGKRLLMLLCNSLWINPLLRNTSTAMDAVSCCVVVTTMSE
jgi:hypothetical protein